MRSQAEDSSSSPMTAHESLSNPMSPDPKNGANPAHNPEGVSTCYVFKSRLQEYAQKVGIPTPVYQTVKEGPSHEPVFKSTVIVNNIRYDSLPGFFNRKAAEQSAAEVALVELHKSGQMTESLPTVHETGLCKNLLQEYAQKMNYAIPSYICNKQPSGVSPFTCTVEIGGIQYIGAAARTKKEAEIKAARTALLAIQSQSEANMNGTSQYTVLPGKRKGRELETQTEPVKPLKPKKAKFKKKWTKRRLARNKDEAMVKLDKDGLGPETVDVSRAPADEADLSVLKKDAQDQLEGSVLYGNEHGMNTLAMENSSECQNVQQNGSDFNHSVQGSHDMGNSLKGEATEGSSDEFKLILI